MTEADREVLRPAISRHRADLAPEGYYRGGPGIRPAWLVGRRIHVVHERHHIRGEWWWCAFTRARQGRHIVDEQVEVWDAVPLDAPSGRGGEG